VTTSQLARALGIARSSLDTQPKRPQRDKALAVHIEERHERDETMGHRTRAVVLTTGQNRVKRVRHTEGISARRHRTKDVSPGKAAHVAPNRWREGQETQVPDVMVSDICEVRLAAGSRGRGCFALRTQTRHSLGLAFD
jgi:putative transposase